MRIHLAAFEPFGERRVNRSAQVLERVGAVEGVTLEKTVLPVAFAALPDAVEAILAGAPDAVLLMGEAKRWSVSVERVGRNLIDARIPDNRGERPAGAAVIAGGAATLASTFAADAVRAALRAAGVAAVDSDDAGAFACNAALYLTLARARCPAGFLHVPVWRWPLGPRLHRLARAVEAALAALRDQGRGIRSSADMKADSASRSS